MEKALDIAALCVDHAKAAFELMGSDQKNECAKHILKWIKREGAGNFTARGCGQAVKGRYKRMTEVNEGLVILDERFFIRKKTCAEGGAGRPSQGYEVNPQLWGEK
jgi:hypothetical protein